MFTVIRTCVFHWRFIGLPFFLDFTTWKQASLITLNLSMKERNLNASIQTVGRSCPPKWVTFSILRSLYFEKLIDLQWKENAIFNYINWFCYGIFVSFHVTVENLLWDSCDWSPVMYFAFKKYQCRGFCYCWNLH